MAPPAKRTSDRFPPHIDIEKLPTGKVTYDPRGRGRWIYRVDRGKRGRGKETRFGNAKTSLAEIWQFVESLENDSILTFRGLSLEFQNSKKFRKLAAKTQSGYKSLHKQICESETKSGDKLGDLPLEAWTPGAVRRFLESRESESSGAAQVRYIKRVFSWGIQFDYVSINPAKGVELGDYTSERTHYVQDPDYCFALHTAPLNIALVAHLSYLTSKRRTDILTITRRQITPAGIEFTDNKTGKLSIVGWSDELRATVDLARELAGSSMLLFPKPGNPSQRFTDSAFDTAWQRLRAAMKKAGRVPFQFKDLRAKHASDLETDEQASEQLLHSDGQVTRRHYRRRPKKIHSIR